MAVKNSSSASATLDSHSGKCVLWRKKEENQLSLGKSNRLDFFGRKSTIFSFSLIDFSDFPSYIEDVQFSMRLEDTLKSLPQFRNEICGKKRFRMTSLYALRKTLKSFRCKSNFPTALISNCVVFPSPQRNKSFNLFPRT